MAVTWSVRYDEPQPMLDVVEVPLGWHALEAVGAQMIRYAWTYRAGNRLLGRYWERAERAVVVSVPMTDEQAERLTG